MYNSQEDHSSTIHSSTRYLGSLAQNMFCFPGQQLSPGTVSNMVGAHLEELGLDLTTYTNIL